ncbi:hypothetical protein [Streptomyces shenzhenensis]|uniref:hypothetical protein n=1 Tax=Streptomyces shenzhenensis TaxID=943815 RepID=UPI003690ED28
MTPTASGSAVASGSAAGIGIPFVFQPTASRSSMTPVPGRQPGAPQQQGVDGTDHERDARRPERSGRCRRERHGRVPTEVTG